VCSKVFTADTLPYAEEFLIESQTPDVFPRHYLLDSLSVDW